MPLLFKENKQTTINTNCELAILDFEKIKENLDIKNIDPEEFKIFANDLSASLLEFHKGKILDEKGLYYLYIYGANCYGVDGLDKKSFDERYE
jgi:hypothetical protein